MSIESRSRQFGKVFDHWQIKEFLGSGSGGKTAVFRLQRMDSSWGVCALKIVNLIEAQGSLEELTDAQLTDYQAAREECSRNAEQEVRLMDELRGNTNIVDYLDHTFVDWSEENAFGRDLLIRMELLTDLRSELRRGKCFSEAEIIKIGRDICTALVRCHSKNILHRDVKPENIFRNKDGDYKLGDFGVSRVLDACPGAVASTGIGTYEYWPAEQMTGSYDKRVDIYSLGLVLYELSNRNRLPFAATTYATGREASLRLAGTALPKPMDASPALAEIILKACAFKPEERYQSAKAFLKALGQAAQTIERTPEEADAPDRRYATAPARPSDDSDSVSEIQSHENRKPVATSQPSKPKKSTGGSYLKEQRRRKKKSMRRVPVFLTVLLLLIAVGALLGARAWKSMRYSPENKLLEAEISEEIPAASQIPEDDQDSTAPPTSTQLDAEYAAAEALVKSGKTAEAAMAFYKLGDKERSFALWDEVANRDVIAAQWQTVIGVCNDGTVACDENCYIAQDIKNWNNIVDISTDSSHVLGLKEDGTAVVACSHNQGQCDVSDWSDVVSISTLLGLKADGTVVANSSYYDADVDGWENIVAVSGGVGLRTDGTVVTLPLWYGDTSGWKDIVSIRANSKTLVGMKADGTVIAAGENKYGEVDVDEWQDIVDIALGEYHTAGLKSDGTVVALGRNDYGELDVDQWQNIVAIAAGEYLTVGLKADGTIVAAGKNSNQQLNGDNWSNIMFPRVSPDLEYISDIQIVPKKSAYCVGYPLREEDFEIVATYQKGGSETQKSFVFDCVFSPSELDSPGTQEVSVSCGGFTKDITLEAVDFYKLEAYIDNPSDAGYNEGGNVNWVLHIKASYVGNYVDYTRINLDIRTTAPSSFDLAVNWKRSQNGETTIWGSSVSALKTVYDQYDEECVALPDDPSIAGYYSAKVDIGGIKKTVYFELVYKGDYATGTGWEITDVSGTFPTTEISSDASVDVEQLTLIRSGAEYAEAEKLAQSGKTAEAAMAFYKLGDKECSFELWDKVAVRDTVSTGSYHTVAMRTDGTFVATGGEGHGARDIDDWMGFVAVSAGGVHTVGLKPDGRVVAVGNNDSDQCNVRNWRDIVAISAGADYTLGLKADGTVVATAHPADEFDYGQCNVDNWDNIVAVCAGGSHTVGLKADGTVVAVGLNILGQCDVSTWADIVAVFAGEYCTVGLKSNGTVLLAGSMTLQDEVAGWTDIIAISSGDGNVVGLKSDGTVVVAGSPFLGEYVVDDWNDIVAINSRYDHIIGLKSDGTLLGTGRNDENVLVFQQWNNIMLPGFDQEQMQSDPTAAVPSSTLAADGASVIANEETAAEAIRDIPAGTKLIDGTWENGNITVVALDDKTLWMQITDDRPDQQYESFGTPWEIDLRFGTEMKIEESADDYYIAHPFNIVMNSTASRQLELREYAQEDGMDDSSQRGFNNLHFWQTETDGKRANSLHTALLDIEQNGNTYTTVITLPEWFDTSVYDDLVCVDVCLFKTDFYEKLHQEGSAQGDVHPFYPTNS